MEKAHVIYVYLISILHWYIKKYTNRFRHHFDVLFDVILMDEKSTSFGATLLMQFGWMENWQNSWLCLGLSKSQNTQVVFISNFDKFSTLDRGWPSKVSKNEKKKKKKKKKNMIFQHNFVLNYFFKIILFHL